MLTDEQVQAYKILRDRCSTSGRGVHSAEMDGNPELLTINWLHNHRDCGIACEDGDWYALTDYGRALLAEHERDAALARCAELEARAKRAEAAIVVALNRRIFCHAGCSAYDSALCCATSDKVPDGCLDARREWAYAEADRRIAEGKGGSE